MLERLVAYVARMFSRKAPKRLIGRPRTRLHCPFYGFHRMGNGMDVMFLDQDGNECALDRDYSPCRMETGGETPNWERCPLNAGENVKKVRRLIPIAIVFPNEFRPLGERAESWGGIPLKDWMAYVAEDNTPPSASRHHTE